MAVDRGWRRRRRSFELFSLGVFIGKTKKRERKVEGRDRDSLRLSDSWIRGAACNYNIVFPFNHIT